MARTRPARTQVTQPTDGRTTTRDSGNGPTRRESRLAPPFDRTLMEALGVAVYTTDAFGRITFYNEAAADLWGRRPTIGRDLWCGSWRLYWPDGSPMPHEACPMAVTLRENRPVRGAEAIAERPDGTRVAFVPYPTPVRDTSGALIGAVNVLVDVTNRRRAEDALRRANEAKDEFLGLVSHELRTPITVIFGGARMLDTRYDQLADEAKRDLIQHLDREASRLRRVMEDLLVLARMELGQTISTEPIHLPGLIASVVNTFSEGGDRPMHVDVAAGLPPVAADRTYLEQVLRNLLTNALKYAPASEPIEVSAARIGAEVRISVLDRGPGVATEELASIFGRFYRAERTSTKSGLGLGLTVCRRLVEAQSGRIWAELRPGGGLAVRFTLPVYKTAEEEDAGPEPLKL